MGPPRSINELLERARGIEGLRLGDLGARRAHKGSVGQLIEDALGADGGSHRGPDFRALEVELKSVPIGANGKITESTWVCTVDLDGICEQTFEGSDLWHKLARVLFVCVEAAREVPTAERRVGASFLWQPSDDERLVLEDDWTDFKALISEGWVEAISARRGAVLQMRPKARDASVRRTTTDKDGEPFSTSPRGFYLRRAFVQGVVDRALEKRADAL